MQVFKSIDLVKHLEPDHRISGCTSNDENNSITGKIIVCGLTINFIITLTNFPIELPNYFINKDELPYKIPHAYSSTKLKNYYWLCYTRKENLFWDIDNTEDIIMSTFNAFYDCVSNGINRTNLNDFKGEFIYFWQRTSTPDKRLSFKSYIAPSHKIKIVKYNKNNLIYDHIQDLYNFHKKEEIEEEEILNALYLPVKEHYDLIPPETGKMWNNKDFEEIINNGLDDCNKDKIEKMLDTHVFDTL